MNLTITNPKSDQITLIYEKAILQKANYTLTTSRSIQVMLITV